MWRKKIKSLRWDVASLSANVLPAPGGHMERIRARCSQCLMKSMFVFCQQYIRFGPFPVGLLWTHMEVICWNSSAGKETGGAWDFGVWNKFERLGLGGGVCYRGCRVLGFLWEMPFKELRVRFQCFLNVRSITVTSKNKKKVWSGDYQRVQCSIRHTIIAGQTLQQCNNRS